MGAPYEKEGYKSGRNDAWMDSNLLCLTWFHGVEEIFLFFFFLEGACGFIHIQTI